MANPRIDELKRRIEREPGSRLFSQLAEELRKEGDLAEAIRVARAGLAAHPNYPSARLTLGRALFDTGQFGPARVELEGVLRGAPDNILAARMLAECLEGLGDPGAALLQFRAAQRLSPDDKQIEAQLRSIEQRLAAGGQARTPAPPTPVSGSAPPAGGPLEIPTPPVVPGGPSPPPLRPLASAFEASTGAPPVPLSSASGPSSSVVEDFDDVFDPSPAWKRSHGTSAAPREETILLLEEESYEAPLEIPAASGPPAEPNHKGVAGGADTLAGAPAFVVPFPPPDFASAEADLVPPAGEAPGNDGTSTAAFAAWPAPPQEPVPPPPLPQGEALAEASADASLAALQTPTLAELYCDQGFFDKAVEVYEQILEREPHNERVRARLIEVKALSHALPAPPAPDPRAAERIALQRKIVRLEQMLAAVRKG